MLYKRNTCIQFKQQINYYCIHSTKHLATKQKNYTLTKL